MFIAANTRQPATASNMYELADYMYFLKWYFSKYYQVQLSRSGHIHFIALLDATYITEL